MGNRINTYVYFGIKTLQSMHTQFLWTWWRLLVRPWKSSRIQAELTPASAPFKWAQVTEFTSANLSLLGGLFGRTAIPVPTLHLSPPFSLPGPGQFQPALWNPPRWSAGVDLAMQVSLLARSLHTWKAGQAMSSATGGRSWPGSFLWLAGDLSHC